MTTTKSRSLSRIFIQGSTVSLIATLLIGIMNYWVRRTLALQLSEIEFGFLYSVLSMIFLVLAFLDLGFSQAGTILMSRHYTHQKPRFSRIIYGQIFTIKLCLSMAVFILGFLLAKTLTHRFFGYPAGTTLFCVLLSMVIFQALESAPLSVFDAQKAFTRKNLVMVFRFAFLLLVIQAWVPSQGLKAAVVGFSLASLLGMVVAMITVKLSFGLWPLFSMLRHKRLLRSMMKVSLWIAVSNASLTAMYYMDTLCLTWQRGLTSVAQYNIALPIMQIVQSLIVFPAILTPLIAEMWQHQEIQKIKNICRLVALLLLACLPLVVIMGIYFSERIILLLFDDRFIAVAPTLNILWIAMIFFAIANTYLNTLNAIGKQKTAAILLSVAAVFNVFLNILLIPKWDIKGAAIATATTYLIVSIFGYVLVRTELQSNSLSR